MNGYFSDEGYADDHVIDYEAGREAKRLRLLREQAEKDEYNKNAAIKESLSESVELMAELNGRLACFRAQYDEMLADLDDLVLACELPGDHCEVEQALPRARAVLSKARGLV